VHRFRALWLARVVVALFVGSFASVAAASIACQAACAYSFSEGRAAGHASEQVPQSRADHELSRNQAADHFRQSGPCHLAVVSPNGDVEWNTGLVRADPWRGIASNEFRSFISPPPEHRPRA
jgi:hypothetical protein